MKILRIRIENYKSFLDSGWVEIGGSRTVVVGQNNSGKTAFLQALRFNDNQQVRYRGPLQTPDTLSASSEFSAEFLIDGSALKEQVIISNEDVFVPIPQGQDDKVFVDALWEKQELLFSIKTSAQYRYWKSKYPSHNLFNMQEGGYGKLVRFERDSGKISIYGSTGSDNLPQLLNAMRDHGIYVFDPERLKIGACPVAETHFLDPSARNLPAVLSTMSRNPAKWEKFKSHVREVFPSIKEVAVSSLGAEIAVYIWQNDPKTATGDYAILLQESGTGVAQVLGILYVAMTRSGNIIAIDEPNSFLHPGAAKKLMNILKDYDKNQYIVSTHSPELISVFEPDTLLSVFWRAGKSHIEKLDRRSLDDIERVLLDLGCELADVFAAERVVWCEGPTEVRSFPLIAQAAGIDITTTKFLELRATGDLEGSKVEAETVLAIYGIMSRGSSLLPRLTVFNLDREGRSKQKIQDLSRLAGGRVNILPARTFENFVVDAQAIAAVLAIDYQRTNTEGAPPTAAEIQSWLDANYEEYIDGARSEDWEILQIDAPKMLDRLFDEITNTLHIYRKTHHTVELVRWLLGHKPTKLSGLTEYVRNLLAE